VRQYSAERLAEAGETAALRDRHLAHFLELVDRAAPDLYARGQTEWLDTAEQEEADLRAALDWSITGRRDGESLRLASGLAFFYVTRGDPHDGYQCIIRALSANEPAPSVERSQALFGAAYVALSAADHDRGLVHAMEAAEIAGTIGDVKTRARALDMAANIEVNRDLGRARELLAESIALAEQAGDDWCLGHGMQLVAWSWTQQDVLEAAERWRADAYEVVLRVGTEHFLAWHWLGTAITALSAGRIAAGADAARRAVGLATQVGDLICRAWSVLVAVEVDGARGRASRHRRTVDEFAAELAPLATPPAAAAAIRAARGQVALASGELGQAERDLRAGAELAGEASLIRIEADCLLALADLALFRGESPAASELTDAATRLSSIMDNQRLGAAAAHCQARIALADGDPDRAFHLCHEALESQRAGGYRADAITTLETLAGLLARRGASRDAARIFGACDAARSQLGTAHRRVDLPDYHEARARLVEELDAAPRRACWRAGAALSLDEAVAYATRGRGRRGRPAIGWASLTPTELTLVRHVAEGRTNADIGRRMLVSPATVKAHLAHVFAKLGVSNRTELAAVAGQRFR
jgi:DNA-binding CsgD family transcriptional regulator